MNIIYGYDVPYSEALVMSKLHKLSDHRSYLCDDFFKKILLNSNDKLHGLLPNNISVISSLRNKRNFTIIKAFQRILNNSKQAIYPQNIKKLIKMCGNVCRSSRFETDRPFFAENISAPHKYCFQFRFVRITLIIV